MVYEPKPLQSSVMMLFFHFKDIGYNAKDRFNKHFSSGGIQEIEVHKGPYMPAVSSTRCFSNYLVCQFCNCIYILIYI